MKRLALLLVVTSCGSEIQHEPAVGLFEVAAVVVSGSYNDNLNQTWQVVKQENGEYDVFRFQRLIDSGKLITSKELFATSYDGGYTFNGSSIDAVFDCRFVVRWRIELEYGDNMFDGTLHLTAPDDCGEADDTILTLHGQEIEVVE